MINNGSNLRVLIKMLFLQTFILSEFYTRIETPGKIDRMKQSYSSVELTSHI